MIAAGVDGGTERVIELSHQMSGPVSVPLAGLDAESVGRAEHRAKRELE